MKYTPATINALSELAGVYLFKNKTGTILYVGKAKNLKKRVSSYFQQTSKPVKTINLVSQIFSIEIIPVNSEYEALLLEAKLVKKYQPKYNVILKDDKHYIYIKITADKFPRILILGLSRLLQLFMKFLPILDPFSLIVRKTQE